MGRNYYYNFVVVIIITAIVSSYYYDLSVDQKGCFENNSISIIITTTTKE